MEDEKSFSDICGGRVVLRRRYYSPYCREFGLSSARLSLRSLTAVTCAVWLAAYGLFTLCENSMILSAAIFITIIGLLGYLHFVKIDQETLLIIDSLGIQMTSSYASGKESTTFIEMDKVKDVIINEAIYMQKVIYYLCILLKDPGKPHEISQVVPVFQGYSEVLQTSLYLKPWGEEKTDNLSLKLFPTFQASGILFIIPLYFYCTALVNICAQIQTHTKAGGIA
ncbi:phosphatidylinositol N-acetylglucosaminyltransferase subunit H isoform X1 [Microtus pennsylvanicus]|uniref:phosphatidylinositol N-acetylglucosaminyltransferase subunit H isoform X1 n=1 Tax=Microtus pennsylvanicus TaxID=10058 RepID=UPI003F6D720F